MPTIITQELKFEEMPTLDVPVEQLTRIVGFYTMGVGELVARSYGSGFFDPSKLGFLVTSAHNLVGPHGLASSVKIKGYDASGKKFSMWGLGFALFSDYDEGVGTDVAVIWLQFTPTVTAPVPLKEPTDGYYPAYLKAYNSDASFDLHEPQTSSFNTLAAKDRLIYQSASGTKQMSGAPVIRSGKPAVIGIHNGIDNGQYVAARIDLNLLNALYAALS